MTKLKNISRFTSMAIFLATYCFLVYFIFIAYKPYFNSDSAAKILLADGIVHGSNFYASWISVNNDFWVFSTHLFVLPFLVFLPTGYLAYALGATLFSVFFLGSAWLLLSKFNISKSLQFLILAVLSSGISPGYAEHIFGQFSYGVGLSLAIIFLLLYFTINSFEKNGFKRHIFESAIGVIFLLTFWGNPHRALVFYFLPLIFAIYLYSYHSLNDVTLTGIIKHNIRRASVILVSSILGWYLHKLFQQMYAIELGVTDSPWVSFHEMWSHTIELMGSVFEVLGGRPPAGEKIKSVLGFYFLIRFVNVVVFLWLVKQLFSQNLASENKNIYLVFTYAVANFLLVSFFLVASTLNGIDRYLMPSLALFLIAVLSIKTLSITPFMRYGQYFVAAILILSGPITYIGANSKSFEKIDLASMNLQNFGQFLIQNNLKYGYATFYNADATTVLNDSKVLIRHINVINGLPVPYLWLSSLQWYRPSAHIGNTFLALSKSESESLSLSKLKSYGLTPLEILHFQEMVIYVFPENLAAKLPKWPN